jgi:hypothetical protein
MGNKMPVIIAILFFMTMFAAWLQHVVTCLQDGSWGFLIAGAIMFPIAIVHGIGIWFGVF